MCDYQGDVDLVKHMGAEQFVGHGDEAPVLHGEGGD